MLPLFQCFIEISHFHVPFLWYCHICLPSIIILLTPLCILLICIIAIHPKYWISQYQIGSHVVNLKVTDRKLPIHLLNPFVLRVCWWSISGKKHFWEIFEEKMLIRTLPTTLFQIFCVIILKSPSYYQEYHRSRWQNLEKFLSMNGLKSVIGAEVSQTKWAVFIKVLEICIMYNEKIPYEKCLCSYFLLVSNFF